MGRFKYGVLVPRMVKEAYEIDKKNGNSLWHDAIKKEIDALMSMNTFERLSKGKGNSAVPKDAQFAPLRMIFDVKQDLCRKARLVIGGHVVDSTDYDTFAPNMKGLAPDYSCSLLQQISLRFSQETKGIHTSMPR